MLDIRIGLMPQLDSAVRTFGGRLVAWSWQRCLGASVGAGSGALARPDGSVGGASNICYRQLSHDPEPKVANIDGS